MFFQFLLGLYVIGFYEANARTDQEIKAWFFREGIDCNTEYPLTPSEMMMLKENKLPETTNAKCFAACLFKKTGMMNKQGMYDADASIAMIEKDFADDPPKLESSKKLLEACRRTVNDQAVTDGEKGCDRSVFLHKCFVETASELGIKLP